MNNPQPSNNTSCDIAIIGAGPAGVTAAVAARRAGAGRVVLVELSDKLGGAVTHALHRSICGLYAKQPANLTHTLNAGLQREVVTHMAKLAPDHVQLKQMGKACVLEFPPQAWQHTLEQLCDEAGVALHMNTRVKSVKRHGSKIQNLQLEHLNLDANNHAASTGSLTTLQPAVVIDATGQGHLLKLAGDDTYQPIPAIQTPSRMMGGYAMRLGNLTGDLERLRLQIPFTLAKAVVQNQLPAIARLTVFHPGPLPGQGVCKMAVSPGELMEPAAVAQRANAIFNHLKQSLESLAVATILEQSPTPQARDGLRLRGQFLLTQNHVLEGKSFDETNNDLAPIKAWWPIEWWDDERGPTYQFGPVGLPYDIPMDSLRCLAVSNLLAAGMNISADAQAAASLRASGICLAIGDAAGRVAQSML